MNEILNCLIQLMAKLFFITHILVLSTQPPFNPPIFFYIFNIVLHSFVLPFTLTIPITTTNTENYLPSDDPNIANLLVSHYDCEKQHYLRHSNLINVKQGTEAPSNIQHASVRARVFVTANAKRFRAYKCVAYAKKEKKMFSRLS